MHGLPPINATGAHLQTIVKTAHGGMQAEVAERDDARRMPACRGIVIDFQHMVGEGVTEDLLAAAQGMTIQLLSGCIIHQSYQRFLRWFGLKLRRLRHFDLGGLQDRMSNGPQRAQTLASLRSALFITYIDIRELRCTGKGYECVVGSSEHRPAFSESIS